MDASSDAATSLIRRLLRWARRHWVIATVGAAAAVGVGIWLVFFFFAVHLYWVDDEVDEALPTFGAPVAPASVDPEPAPAPLAEVDSPSTPEPPPAVAEEPQVSPAPVAPSPAEGADPAPPPADDPAPEAAPPPADNPAPEAAPPPPVPVAADVEGPMVAGPGASGMPGDEITPERAAAMNEAMASGAMPLQVVMNEERPMPVAPQIVTLVSGEFSSRSHHTEGRALVLNDGSEQRFLRFENFRTDNGPDVNVYLSAAPPDAPARDLDVDFIDLGDMKGNVGAQNYEIPPSVDLDHYSTVVVWCVRFSVAFGVAPLA